jgi:hypothetical protein
MSERCTACPVELGRDCLATLDPFRFGRFCIQAAAREPIHLQHIRARAEIGIEPPAAPADHQPPPAWPIDPEHVLLILACDYRDKSQACGCGELDYCAQARGSDPEDLHAVSYADCRRCAAGREPP